MPLPRPGADDRMQALPSATAVVRPRIVLDSNAVLDWLYFRDPRCIALAEAVTTARVEWIASAAMHDEIEHVLGRNRLGAKWPDGIASVRAGWQRWATMVEGAAPPAPAAMRCTDIDDQSSSISRSTRARSRCSVPTAPRSGSRAARALEPGDRHRRALDAGPRGGRADRIERQKKEQP